MKHSGDTFEKPEIGICLTREELERVRSALEMDKQGRGVHENLDLIKIINSALKTSDRPA